MSMVGNNDSIVGKAEAALSQGDLPTAVSYYRQALTFRPENSSIRNNLACLLLQLGENELAIQILEEDDSPSTAIQATLGYALMNIGRLEAAVVILRKIIADQPDSVEARNHLGMALLRNDDAHSALEEFIHAHSLSPNSLEVLNNLGCAHWKLNDSKAAIDSFQKAIQIDPYNVDAHNNLGCLFREDLNLEDALDEFRISEQIEPDQASIQFNIAQTLLAAKKPIAASSHLERAQLLGFDSKPIQELRQQLEAFLQNSTFQPTKDH